MFKPDKSRKAQMHGGKVNLADLLKSEEGFRDEVYLDSQGIPTCGWGHALHVGSKVPLASCQAFFEADLAQVEKDYPKLGLHLDPVRETVVKAMLFQMGLKGVLAFKDFLSAAREGKWELAAAHMLDSKWARKDSPKRAVRMANLFLKGSE